MSQAPVQIVMIGSPSKRVEQAAQYLNRRDCQCFHAPDVRSGLDAIARLQPKLVLLSWNLSTDFRPQAIMDAIRNTFKVPLVVFAENGDGRTAVELSQLPLRHVLYAPVSGPKFHMKVLQVLKELEDEGDAYFAPALATDKGKAPPKRDVAVLGLGNSRARTTEIAPEPKAPPPRPMGTIQGPLAQTALAHSAQKALADAVKPATQPKVPLQNSEQICALPIRSKQYSGYLLILAGGEVKVDSVFLEIVRTRLLNYLSTAGEATSVDEKSFILEVGNAQILPWAQKYADFLILSQSGSDEIAMAFVRDNEAIPIFAESATQDMVTVDIEKIPTGLDLTFDLFLYLPQNNKYIKYVRQGGQIGSEQLSRLKVGHVEKFHIHAVDREKVQALCGSTSLRTRILRDKSP